MNILKIQQDALKAMIKEPKTVTTYPIVDEQENPCTFLTINRAAGYIIPDHLLLVDLTGAQTMLALDLAELVRPENLLTGTDDYRLGGTARRYEKTDTVLDDVYIKTELLKYFDLPQLYQDPYKPLGMIAVTETDPDDGRPVLAGLVMPCKVDTDDKDD